MHKYLLIMVLVLIPSVGHSVEVPSFIKKHVPNVELVGKGRLVFLIWDAYDAMLYAPHGKWSDNTPFALRLSYLRSIDGDDIAERSIEEIRALGFSNEAKLGVWHQQMRVLFPDVDDGTELTGIFVPGKETIFYLGSEEIGRVSDPEFGDYFFAIWLSENTSEPQLRKQLVGM